MSDPIDYEIRAGQIFIKAVRILKPLADEFSLLEVAHALHIVSSSMVIAGSDEVPPDVKQSDSVVKAAGEMADESAKASRLVLEEWVRKFNQRN